MRNAPALHGRDHCPGGADPIPCISSSVGDFAWAESTAAQTIPALGSVTLSWTMHLNTNSAVFGTGSSPVIEPGNAGIVIAELKVLVDDVGAKVTAALAGDVLTQLDGGNGRWFWPGNDEINTDPQNVTQEFGMKDIAVAYTDGAGTRTILGICTTADAGSHNINYALLHVSFFACTNEIAQVYP